MAAKRLKAKPLASEAEFHATINEIARLQAEHLAIAARRDRAVQRIRERYSRALAPLDDAIDAKMTLADAYGTAHRAELLPKDRKSRDLDCASYGWRTGNRTVKITPKTTSEEDVIALLKAHGLALYVRTEESIAKDKILADCKDDLTLPVVHQDAEADATTIELGTLHLKISQGESFYVEPKVTTGDTLKPEEA